ncbi:MAG: hypothetical protein WC455_29770 [Dehalococcoidia bacterium]|jgi:hypothetical protein
MFHLYPNGLYHSFEDFTDEERKDYLEHIGTDDANEREVRNMMKRRE